RGSVGRGGLPENLGGTWLRGPFWQRPTQDPVLGTAVQPFGFHVQRGAAGEVPKGLQGCTFDARSDGVLPGSSTAAHCAYAVQYEFPWFPLLAGLSTSPEVKSSMAEAIAPLVRGGVQMARRWWLAYELFHEALPLEGLEEVRGVAAIPFLPPERFFCVSGELSARHGVVDNLLGGRDFCPFVEKFAGAADASREFHAELLEVLSPIPEDQTAAYRRARVALRRGGGVSSGPASADRSTARRCWRAAIVQGRASHAVIVRGGNLYMTTAWRVSFRSLGRRWIWTYSGPRGLKYTHVHRPLGHQDVGSHAVDLDKSPPRNQSRGLRRGCVSREDGQRFVAEARQGQKSHFVPDSVLLTGITRTVSIDFRVASRISGTSAGQNTDPRGPPKAQAYAVVCSSAVCMLTVKEFLAEGGIDHGGLVDRANIDRLVGQLSDSGFVMSEQEVERLAEVFCLAPGAQRGSAASSLRAFAVWIRGEEGLASRLREHLLGAVPADYRWHAPGEDFLERLSRVISHIETRASQMIEGELPPEKKARFFVDVISNPWDRDGVCIDAALCTSLQQGLLSADRYKLVSKTQVDGGFQRINQNWVSSEKYDDMVGKVKELHHLPPPPTVLDKLLDGYFACVQKMMADERMDPIVCATIAKVAFNTIHPMVDGNGRVQRMIFQLVLFKYGFLPRLNVPVSVIMLQDRTAYEVMQGRHVEQVMAGVVYEETETDVEEGGDGFRHVDEGDGIMALYQYQDFTFAVSSMMKLMQNTLPVIAAKAYFLQRFDWRVDELLKGDALMPPRAATRIAKVFKNDGGSGGISVRKLVKLLLLDGWRIGFRRIFRFLAMASRAEDKVSLKSIGQRLSDSWRRSRRRLWIMSSGQVMGSSSTGRVRWVGVSLDKFAACELALRRALKVSNVGDTVVAVHYPKDMSDFSADLFPELANDINSEVKAVRAQLMAKVQGVVDAHMPEGVLFRAFIGPPSAYRPAYSLCEDAKVAEVKPYRIYTGYDQFEHHRTFTDYVVRHAPCDVTLVKGDFSAVGTTVRWVGISARNFDISGSALIKAFAHSKPGDSVIAMHYPVNPFVEGMSSVFEAHMSSMGEAEMMNVLMDNEKCRAAERAERIANQWCKDGVRFEMYVGELTSEPHVQIVRDAETGVGEQPQPPHTIYIGYTGRTDRDRLVDPSKMYDVAEYIVRRAPCNVVIVKESQQAMRSRIHGRRHLPVVSADGP
ncbi:unnamed protein product, partial [Prorocentrum cordatum]